VQAWRAAVPRRRGSPISTALHGADGAGALQGIGRQWPMRFAGDLEGWGPSPPWFADIHSASWRRRSGRPPGNRPAMAHAFRCSLEGWGPSPPWFAVIHTASRRRRSGRPPGNRPAMAHAFRWRPGGLRSLAAVVRRNPHRFMAPTERTPSREPAGNGPCVSVETWRAAVPRSRGSP